MEVIKAENKKQVGEITKVKKENTDLKDKNNAYKKEIQNLKCNASKTEKDLVAAQKTLEKMKDMEKLNRNVVEENEILKANKESYQKLDGDKIEELVGKVKQKDTEIENLYLILRKNSDNGSELLKVNEKLDKQVEQLKEIIKNSVEVGENKYQCDNCENGFKTAGLLRRHHKNEHEKKIA